MAPLSESSRLSLRSFPRSHHLLMRHRPPRLLLTLQQATLLTTLVALPACSTCTTDQAASSTRAVSGEQDAQPLPEAVGAVLRPLGARPVDAIQDDFSRFQGTRHTQWVARPTSTDEAVALVRAAVATRTPVRVRGRGHSMSGSAIGGPHELLLDTRSLVQVCRIGEDVVRAEAGVSMHDLREALQIHTLLLPVINDGGRGPTVGGFLSAGGFGAASPEHGGIWELTTAIEFVDGHGELRMVGRQDELFRWFFGSAGQLGLIVAARLRVLVPDEARAAPLDVGACVQVPTPPGEERWDVSANEGERLFWWTVLTPAGDAEDARQALALVQASHSEGPLVFLQAYHYHLPSFGLHPPLLLAQPGDGAAVGVWAMAPPGAPEEALRRQVVGIEAAVAQRSAERGWRRYLGAELSRGAEAYRRSLGDDVWNTFRGHKDDVDPLHLFGRGNVFPIP